MKFSVNLATQPYRKDRPILVASGAVAVLMIGSLILLIWLAVADHGRSAVTHGWTSRFRGSRKNSRVWMPSCTSRKMPKCSSAACF
jgi:hypothetical protein